ncbi:hypothetical protein TNCV_4615711 [Trichonephila clavipes]|nr:hypothetical protein TNCV_4615711 [Trichonephila clavipes]
MMISSPSAAEDSKCRGAEAHKISRGLKSSHLRDVEAWIQKKWKREYCIVFLIKLSFKRYARCTENCTQTLHSYKPRWEYVNNAEELDLYDP